ELGDHETRGSECPARGRQGKPNAGVAEGDDIFPAVAVHVRQKPDVFFHTPPLVVTEVGDHIRDRTEARRRGERPVNSGIAESDDIIQAVAVHVACQAYVLRHAPAAVIAKIREREGRADVVSVRVTDPNAVYPKAHDILFAVAVDIRE